ncbi:MAG: TonB family protein [Myxococcales bacterium]
MGPLQRVLWAVAASLLAHAGAAWLIPESSGNTTEASAKSREQAVEVPFEAVTELRAPLPPELLYPRPPPPGGPRSASSLDTAESEAQGGDGAAPEEAMLLFPFLATVELQDTDFNHLELSQTQRIRTSTERATLEQRRATPNSADAVFLASGGVLGHAERRPPAPSDARWGARDATQASERTTSTGSPAEMPARLQAGISPTTRGERPSDSALHDQADQGIFQGRGARASDAARVLHARPNVDRGPAATLSVMEDPRVKDDQDAELLAARLERSLVDASLQHATLRGPGLGGAERDGVGFAPRGAGRGAKASPFAPGAGTAGVLDTSDARYLRWFTNQRARVQDRLVFPEARALSKDQGVSLYRVSLARSGRLLSPPLLLRSSGYADFDASARLAIEQAAPFEELPAALAPDQEELSVVIPVQFDNPMVQ